MPDLKPYDKSALVEIDVFKNPPESWWSTVTDVVAKPFEVVADFAFDNVVGAAVTKAISGIVGLLNDGASWTVRTSAILEEYRDDGHPNVTTLKDIHELDLEQVDRTVGYLGAKYKLLAFGEGAGTGALGAPGIAVDIPALVALALRAVNEYATYYGFDVALESERMFVMQILSAASAPSVAAKQVALAELSRVAVMIAQRKTWEELQRLVTVQIVKKIAEALGIRLTKAKLAQVVPVAGAVVGGGFNAWYVGSVTEAAYLLYRERFLMEKYGPEVAVPVRK